MFSGFFGFHWNNPASAVLGLLRLNVALNDAVAPQAGVPVVSIFLSAPPLLVQSSDFVPPIELTLAGGILAGLTKPEDRFAAFVGSMISPMTLEFDTRHCTGT